MERQALYIVGRAIDFEGNIVITNFKCIYPLIQQYYFQEFIPQLHLHICRKMNV